MRQFDLPAARCRSNWKSNVVIRELPQISRILKWLLLALLAILISYFTFRGYLSPELLIGFANSFSC
ncbi:MAG TPA: hypothetical protein VLT92_01800 [Burkholderiales bacterium]|nr:hypothetical protein [Burkholderiales bacterium]